MTTDKMVMALAADPSRELPGKAYNWRERLNAMHNVSRTFATVYHLSVLAGRQAWQKLWTDTTSAVRANWTRLLDADNYEDLVAALEQPNCDAGAVPTEECCGAVITWQTCLGRRIDDPVRHWLSRGVGQDVLLELMQGDEVCQSCFRSFCSFVHSMVHKTGFSHFSCSMELNSEDHASLAVVHLHATVCTGWKRRGAELQKVPFQRSEWSYDSYSPHTEFTNVKRNADPKKLMTQALFYCAAEKVGSVFQYSSLRPGKDCSSWHCHRVLPGRFLPTTPLMGCR